MSGWLGTFSLVHSTERAPTGLGQPRDCPEGVPILIGPDAASPHSANATRREARRLRASQLDERSGSLRAAHCIRRYARAVPHQAQHEGVPANRLSPFFTKL